MTAMATATSMTAPRMQVLHNSFVSAEKFQQLQTFATKQGVRLEHLNIEGGTLDDLRHAVSGADLLVLDVPRPGDREAVTQRLKQLPPLAGTPRLIIGGGRPGWEGLAPRHAAVLAALYTAGGTGNFERFFALAHALLNGDDPPSHLLADPDRLPETGFYHPKADRVFSRLDAYLAWHASHRKTDTPASSDESRPTGRV